MNRKPKARWKTMTVNLIHGDCLAIMRGMEDESVDAVITDPPYNTTKLQFDKQILDWRSIWKQLLRITKDTAPIVLFSAQPFTSFLVTSQPNIFRYEIIYTKTMAVGFYDANKRPLRAHENILVFVKKFRGKNNAGLSTYNPQYWYSKPYKSIRKNPRRADHYNPTSDPFTPSESKDGRRYPLSYVHFSNGNNSSVHPTQKPEDLMNYLVRTYSNKGDTVLDFTMGSGTTGVACVQTGRNFIGIELDPGYFEIAQARIAKAQARPGLFDHWEVEAEWAEVAQDESEAEGEVDDECD